MSFLRKYTGQLVAVAVAIFVVSSCASIGSKELVILHTNDTHSQIEPIRSGNGRGLAGVDRRGEYFKSVKKEHKNVLILDAGDWDQGTPYFTLFKGDMEIELMNALGYEIVCLGNHEFDNGQEELARRLSMAKFQVVCANYDFSKTPLKDYVKPYTIVKKGGIKIGVIGLLANLRTLVSQKSREGMEYLDPVKVSNEIAQMLKEKEKCDIVIALSHLGYSSQNPKAPSDINLAKNSRNIDIIVGGHSHSYLKSEKIYQNLDGKDVIILQAGAKGEYVGRLDLKFE